MLVEKAEKKTIQTASQAVGSSCVHHFVEKWTGNLLIKRWVLLVQRERRKTEYVLSFFVLFTIIYQD